MHEIEIIRKRIQEAKNIAIAGHTGPDGDAIGACFGLALALKKIGKQPIVLLEPYNIKYAVIPGSQMLYAHDLVCLEVDLFIGLDCSDAARLGAARTVLDKCEQNVCIDHHICETTYAKYSYVRQDASSTSELIYELLQDFIPLDKDIASALYAGIVFDTGGFRHSSTAPTTMTISAALMQYGIEFTNIYNEMTYTHSLIEAKILQIALTHLQIRNNIAYTYITNAEMQKEGATSKDVDGIIDYIFSTRDVVVGIFASEREAGKLKFSLRSKDIDVSKIAAVFSGGGHRKAAGYSVEGALAPALDTLVQTIENELKIHG